MKLLSCYIENFGVLHGKQIDFNGGLNEFFKGNGAGKTTLASFIKAMLYGLPSVRANSKAFDDRQHFYPFNGGKFGGNLTFEAGGNTYRAERFFDKKSDSRDEFTLYKNGRILKDFSANLGKEIFGLDEQSFARTAFFTSSGAEEDGFSSGDINNKLNREVRAEDDLDGALKGLESYKKYLKAARGGGGIIDRKKLERQALAEQTAGLKEIEKGLSAWYEERAKLEDEIAELEKLSDENDAGKREVGLQLKLLEIEREYPCGIPTERELLHLEEKAQSQPQTPEYASNKRGLWLFIVAFLLIAGGAATCFFTLIAGIILIAAGAVALVIAFILKGKKEVEKPDPAEEINAVLAPYKIALSGDIAGGIAKILAKRRAYDGYLEQMNGLRENNSAADSGQLKAELSQKRRRLSAVDAQISNDEAELESLPIKLNRAETLDNEIIELTEKHRRVTLTLEFLEEADRRLKEKYVAPIRGRFGHYAGKITSALGGKMSMGDDFSVSFERGGELKSQKHLSAGQRAVCALCIRLALIDNMYPAEKPFIIMDDPFVSLDKENFAGAAKVLRQLAKDTQIIYFTCHETRKIEE